MNLEQDKDNPNRWFPVCNPEYLKIGVPFKIPWWFKFLSLYRKQRYIFKRSDIK